MEGGVSRGPKNLESLGALQWVNTALVAMGVLLS